MEDVLMKKSFLLNKDNALYNTLDQEGRKEYRFYQIFSILFFAATSYMLWHFLYFLCEMIGSIVESSPQESLRVLLRTFPWTLLTFAMVGMGIRVYNAYRAKDQKTRVHKWKRQGVTCFIVAVIDIAYVVANLIGGRYVKLVEGGPSLLFPLDTIIFSVIAILLGVLCLRYAKKLSENGTHLPFSPRKGNIIVRGLAQFGICVDYMIMLCMFAGFLLCFSVVDWSHEYQFFNVMLTLNYFAGALQFFVYRFVYSDLTDEAKPHGAKVLALCHLILNVVLFALYMLSVQLQPEAPNQNAYGVLPIEFSASFNAFFVVLLLANILTPLIAFVKGLIIDRKKK